MQSIEANRASAEVLRDFREGFTAQDAIDFNTSARSAYSMANCFCGAGIDTFCGIKQLFKSVWAVDNDTAAKLIYNKITGASAFNDLKEVEEAAKRGKVGSYVALMVLTPPCPDFSTGNPNPQGIKGDNGGAIITRIPSMVSKIKPKVVFIEQVANLVNFLDEFTALLHGLHNLNMAVHAAVVRMTQYGDLENCWRLVIVAISEDLGHFADAYRIPLGDFSDDVAYTAECVAAESTEIAERFIRHMRDYEVKPMHNKPSMLKKVAQDAPGFGHSSAPHACYDLRGAAPKCTTHGAGRHQPKGWRESDGYGGPTYMFTPEDVAKHKNLPEDMLAVYKQAFKDLGGSELIGIGEDAFLYKSMGNGFSTKFGTTIYESLHRLLESAGVPHDIIRSEVDAEKQVRHFQAAQPTWQTSLVANQVRVAAFLSNLISSCKKSGGQDQTLPLYEFSLDTGATAVLAWDDQDKYIEDKVKSNAVVSVAKADSQFDTSSAGHINVAVIDQTLKQRAGSRQNVRIKIEDVSNLTRGATCVKMPVITAPRSLLRKQLLGFPLLFRDMQMNLDLRQPEEPGGSCIWYRHPNHSNDLNRRIEIPLRWDAVSLEWTFLYIPTRAIGIEAKEALVEAANDDLEKKRGRESVHLQKTLDKPEVVTAFMIDLIGIEGKQVQQIQFTNVDKELQTDLLGRLPSDKRIEVILGRIPDERNELGVKQSLPNNEKRSMQADAFHSWYGHIGTSKDCAFCRLIRGSMRHIYRIVDKYSEIRMGYMWDMDTLTVNVRSSNGTKYYTCLRDRGSKYIKVFSLQFKDHFIDCFDKWLGHMRRERVFDVYNWNFCSVIKADNDGVWMRKSHRWLALCEKYNIRTIYTNKDRKESNAHAEVCMRIVEHVAKGIMYERGLPATDHDMAVDSAEWLLNRFPTKASLARESIDGDAARPIEMITHGQYSRRTINRELASFVLPGSLVFVHNAKAKGSNFSNPKVVMRIAKHMDGHQLVCFEPKTGIEMKTDSYTLVNPGSRIHWRDNLGIKHVKPNQAMDLPGDAIANREAKEVNKLCDMVLPIEIQKQLKGLKLMKKMDFIKHVTEDKTISLREGDFQRLKSEIDRISADEAQKPPINSHPVNGESEIIEPLEVDRGSEMDLDETVDNAALPVEAEPVDANDGRSAVDANDGRAAGDANDGRSTGDANDGRSTGDANDGRSAVDAIPVFSDPKVRKPQMNEEERAAEKKSIRSLASASRPQSKTALSGTKRKKPDKDGDKPNYDIDWLLKTKHPIEYQQENPKRGFSYDRYEGYKVATTLTEALELGAFRSDLKWDMERYLWWPVKLPTLPEATASESGGQEAVQQPEVPLPEVSLDKESEEEPQQEAAAAVDANTAEQYRAEDDYRLRELKEAMKICYTVPRAMSFSAMATKAKVSQTLFGVYHKWLQIITNGALNEGNIGSFTIKGMKCQPGISVPRPTGAIWSKMVTDHYAPSHIKRDFEPGEESAMLDGFARVNAMSALVRNEMAKTVEVHALAARIRAKDGIKGVEPPPKGVKGLYSIEDEPRRNKFIAAFLKELNDLETMGTISHLHTEKELLERFGVDINKTKSVSTMVVFDNKFRDGATTDPDAKARLCVEGTPRQMTQGVHYDSVYAATPNVDSIFFMNALVVHLKLFRRAFDVGNAYGWAKQDNKLALDYPRGMAQYNEKGEKLYMVLIKNTYGKPDGANLWYKERDTFWLDSFNEESNEERPGWSCRQLIMEQSLFEFKWSRLVDGEIKDDITYLLAWSDDCDMCGTSEEMMEIIETACNNKWKVKSVDPSFMLGIRRTLTIRDDGEWDIHLTQTEFIDGLVGTWESEVAEAGFAQKSPKTPIDPKTFLSSTHYVSEEEYTRVAKRGYKAVCGSLLWVARFCHCEIASSVSMCCRVMMKPSEEAWKACMQMIAWLRDHKNIGIKYSSDRNEHGFVCTSDASNKGDPKDSKCMGSHTVQWKGGTIAHKSGKLPRIGASSGANEFMELRIAGSKVMKFRHLLNELNLHELTKTPTIIYCDSNVAISWIKTGKISAGNHAMDVDWHQPREWEKLGHCRYMGLDTTDMITDIGTKACTEVEYERHLLPMKGHAVWVIRKPRYTMSLT
mgnify:CR=1 FL=1